MQDGYWMGENPAQDLHWILGLIDEVTGGMTPPDADAWLAKLFIEISGRVDRAEKLLEK
jgi:hypothetical protein